jgi:hypothetical protein
METITTKKQNNQKTFNYKNPQGKTIFRNENGLHPWGIMRKENDVEYFFNELDKIKQQETIQQVETSTETIKEIKGE